MSNPNIATAGVATRFKPGPDPRRRKGSNKSTNANMDNALSVALSEALDIIINPRNEYHKEYRTHMIEVVIKYCAPRRKEIDVDATGVFDPTKWFKPDSGEEPAIDITPKPVVDPKFALPVVNGNGKNGTKVKQRGVVDDEEPDDEE